jgi:hypothetical protein
MQTHLITACKEQIAEWESYLAGLSDAQLHTALAPSHWTAKDVLAHVAAWQQRSNARFEAALAEREPVYPLWIEADADPNSEDNIDRTNAAIYELYRDVPLEKVHGYWRDGYTRLLDQAGEMDEDSLLDGGHFTWLNGYSLADVLLGTYEHHREHMRGLREWLEKSINSE